MLENFRANVLKTILGFHPRDEKVMLRCKTIENGSKSFCIKIASNSQKTFYSVVPAVTSEENPQFEVKTNGKKTRRFDRTLVIILSS